MENSKQPSELCYPNCLRLMKLKNLPIIGLLLLGAILLPSCETATGQGAGFGAAAGAILGGVASGDAAGAATGAIIGATTGAIIGASVDEANAVRYGGRPHGGYPYGRRTSTPGFYQSPYPPYQVYNLRGIPHGALIDDRVGGGYFRKP